MQRDYHEKRREREPVVRAVFGAIGVYSTVAELLGYNVLTVTHDVEAMGGPEAFPDLPKNAEERFRSALTLYVKLLQLWVRAEQNTDDAKIRGALSMFLELDRVRRELRAAGEGLYLMTVPARGQTMPPGYWSLVEALFGPQPEFAGTNQHAVLSEVLDDIATKKITVPSGHQELWHHLLRKLRQMDGEKALNSAFAWSETCDKEIVRLIDAALEYVSQHEEIRRMDANPLTLTHLQQCIIRSRYGIGAPKMTLAEMAGDLNVSPERVRQHQVRSLQKLRLSLAPIRDMLNGTIPRLTKQVEDLTEQISGIQTRIQQLEGVITGSVTTTPAVVNLHLIRRVEEFNWSVRAISCLQNAGIVYLWQLAEKREVELIKIKHFGRKTLREVKEVLEALELRLGMSVSPSIKHTQH